MSPPIAASVPWLIVIVLASIVVALTDPPPCPPMVPVAQPFCAPAGVSVLNDDDEPWTFCGDSPDIVMKHT